jgi:hypothetical protein
VCESRKNTCPHTPLCQSLNSKSSEEAQSCRGYAADRAPRGRGRIESLLLRRTLLRSTVISVAATLLDSVTAPYAGGRAHVHSGADILFLAPSFLLVLGLQRRFFIVSRSVGMGRLERKSN